MEAFKFKSMRLSTDNTIISDVDNESGYSVDLVEIHSSFIKKCLEIEEKHEPLLISCTKTEDIESEISEQEVKLSQTEFTVVKSEYENVYVTSDNIKIETEENDERKQVMENFDSQNSEFNILNEELDIEDQIENFLVDKTTGSTSHITTEEIEIKPEVNCADSDVLFHSGEGFDSPMDKRDVESVKMVGQHVVNHKREVETQRTTQQCNFEKRVITQYDLHGEKLKLNGLLVNNKSKLLDAPIYKCYTCNYKTEDKSNLVVHELIHKELKHKCVLCDFRTNKKSSLLTHLQTHKDAFEAQTYGCNKCDLRTKDKYSLVKHQMIHKDPSEFQLYACGICDFRTKHKYSLPLHRLKHKDPSEVQIYKCDGCDYKTKNKRYLVKHQLVHKNPSEVKMYECDTCGLRTKHKSSLFNHQLKHKNPSEVQMYGCDTCDFRTKHKRYLVKHQLLHKSRQIYECDTCEYRTKHRSNLSKHQLIHKGLSEVQCKNMRYVNWSSKYLPISAQ